MRIQNTDDDYMCMVPSLTMIARRIIAMDTSERKETWIIYNLG